MSFIPDNQTSGDSRVIVEKKLKEPDRYRVLLHNDDYTSMEFVVSAIMLAVHQRGVGQCGIYTLEIAEAKVRRVHNTARAAGYPLKCTMEKIH